ncbi:MAG: hypothetical protein OES69_02290 [Myxococcales bacterium]|nr:hypothetical protein [Myxococcales bacterium]MDH3842742.1 hypothetical protein [Myxococcales bacterium]
MLILIRFLVVGLLVVAAACGDDPGLQAVCGNCPEGPVLDGCEDVYSACAGLPTRAARNLCFDQLGSPCDAITE